MAEGEFLPGEPASGSNRFFNMKHLREMKDRTARVRILCPFITGFVRFGEDKKPRRRSETDVFPPGIVWGKAPDGKEQVERRFWAAAIWNYAAEAIQVWEFTQGTVHRQLKDLITNEEWGIPTAYDVKVKSTGEGMDTEYSVSPCKPTALPGEAIIQWKELSEGWVGLEALFHGNDPFEVIPF